jgi:hypothetical protein
MFGVKVPKKLTVWVFLGKVNNESKVNLHTDKMFLIISAKYRVYHMKMAGIFQQRTNCFEKESCVNTVAGLVKRFGT